MSAVKLLNAKYSDLCKELGHLINNKDIIDKRISAIKSEISALDGLMPLLKNYEEMSKNLEKSDKEPV